MKPATALVLVALLGVALLLKSGRPQLNISFGSDKRPQAQAEPEAEKPAEKPKFTEDYDAAMAEKDVRVILVFGAEWCPACVRLKEHLKSANLDGYLVCFVNPGENRKARRAHSVKVLPTSVVCENGEEVSRVVGFESKKYDAWLEDNRK